MEKNQIHNMELKNSLGNAALGIILDNNIIKQSELTGLGLQFGYLFSTEEEQLEGLFKVVVSDRQMYFAVQKGSLMMVNINEEMYAATVNYMRENHPCIADNGLNESDIQKKRREKNNDFIRNNEITVSESLVSHKDDSEVVLKDKAAVCKRAMTCLLVIQIACDIGNDNYEEGLAYFKPMLEKFGLMDELNGKEKRILDGTYSMQDAIDMDWAYETYWSLCWCLGLVDDIKDAGDVCDCQAAIDFIRSCDTTDDFINKCELRSKEEILDMLDLYFRYQWAINDAKVKPTSETGDLDESIVIERRRGLEWIVSEEEDWYDLELWA